MQDLISNEVKKILADAGYNFRLLLTWLRSLLCLLLAVIAARSKLQAA
jgi:hypothetical protein